MSIFCLHRVLLLSYYKQIPSKNLRKQKLFTTFAVVKPQHLSFMHREKDPMGAAIADYHRCGQAGRLRVFSPDFDEDEIPVETLFRSFDEMPELEQEALRLATGRILDVGAGAGCHSLALQNMEKDVTAVEISALSAETMRQQGVHKVLEQDFFNLDGQQYDTILMLMNGIGIVGKLARLPQFFEHIRKLLAPGGQVLLDSTDICYLFEDEDGIIELPDDDNYYGELEYQMQYKQVKGNSFPWLYIDAETLTQEAEKHGFKVEVIARDGNYSFLARIVIS